MNNGAFAAFSGLGLWLVVLALPLLMYFFFAYFAVRKDDEPSGPDFNEREFNEKEGDEERRAG
jgi:hypothetical protein